MSEAPVAPRIVVVMGVSGSGKSSAAEWLHDRLGWVFQEGDSLHPKENVEKMRAGIPLTDADRAPWLATCAAWIKTLHDTRQPGILTCSALKRSYRDTLSQGFDDVVFLYLKVPEAVLKDRLARRTHHYMPGSLLPTQLSTLEPPGPDEPVIEAVAGETVDATMQGVLDRL